MVRRLRLWSGLVLFAFVLTHFANHALGLISLEALAAGRDLFLLLWRSLPGTVLLYASLIVHMALAFWAIYNRRKLDMPRWEGLQLLFGFAIPPLLILHILGNRLAAEFLGTNDTYIYNLLIYFVFQPVQLAKQILVMVVAWLHGRLRRIGAGGTMVRRLRLWSGLVLFAFVLTHFANHALGLISLEALAAGRDLFLLLWRSLPGTVLLYASFRGRTVGPRGGAAAHPSGGREKMD